MIPVNAYAAQSAVTPLAPFSFERRELGPHDIQIDILYCGVCHSDIHQARNEWGGSIFPMVPGHEIVGRIIKVGDHVKNFKVGDLAGVGCFVDSCRTCDNCKDGEEQYCENHLSATYNGYEQDKKTPTYGGYSTQIVLDENYGLHIDPSLPLEAVAPLLCAGITTYSPLKHWKIGKGDKVAVVGLGGLGHMGVKFAVAFGADVTVLSTSRSKEADAKKLGAHHFEVTTEPETLTRLKNKFDFILSTISADHEYGTYLNLLKRDGTMVVVGIPSNPSKLPAFNVIGNRRSLAGSMIGGIRETQEMLDYCAANNIVSDIEVIDIKDINTAYDRML